MNLLDSIKLAFNLTIRDKKNKYYIIFLSLFTLLIISSLAMTSYIKDFINKSINNNVGFRTIVVHPNYNYDDYGLSILKNNEHILEIYDVTYSGIGLESDFKNQNLNGQISLIYGSKNTLPHVIKGKTFKDGDSGVAICPANFYPDDTINDLKVNPKYFVSLDNYYNKEFVVKYFSKKYEGSTLKIDKEFTKKFKVVGLYDNTKTLNMNNECYITSVDLKEIIDTIRITSSDDSIPSYHAVVDSYENVDKVMEELKEKGFENLTTKIFINYDYLNVFIFAAKFILIFVIVVSVILSYLFVTKRNYENYMEIGILKTLGYNKENIATIYLLKAIITSVGALVIGLIFFQIIYFYLKETVFVAFKYIGIDMINRPIIYLQTILLIIVIPLIFNGCLIIKTQKKKIKELVGSEE